MRIVHVVASLDPAYGGPSALVAPLCDALAARGHEVRIITTDRGAKGRYDPGTMTRGGTPIAVSRSHWPRAYAASAGMVPLIWRSLANADVVEIHSLYLFHSLVASRLGRLRKVPYIIRPHGTLDEFHFRERRWKKAPYEMLVERRTIAKSAAVQCLSERERRGVVDHGFTANAIVVPAGVESRPSGAQRVGGSPYLLFLGRITAKKNVDVLLRAYALISSQTRVRLVIAGPDNDDLTKGLIRLTDELGINGSVDFVGPVFGQEKWSILEAATIFVLPSKDESFGVAVLEALAAGTPVVISPDVALAHEVSAAQAGWVIPAEPAALAASLSFLLTNPHVVSDAAVAARALVRDRFTWQQIATQQEDAYAKVIAESR